VHDPPPAESRNDPTATAEPAHEALFAREYEQELEGWLRRRVRIFCLTLLVLSSLSAINVLVDGSAFGPKLVSMIDIAIGVIAIVAVMTHRKIREGGRSDLLRLASIMILILGGSSIASAILRRIAWEQDATITLELFGMHLLACLLLPWRPAESVRPFVPLLLVSIAYKIGSTVPALTGDPAWMLTLPLTAIGAVLVAALAVAPGLLVCWYRMRQHSESFRVRMVGSHFVQLRRELTQARRIHEGMFPEPFDDGRVRFRYLFRPMRELGGDFIHLHQDQRGVSRGTHLLGHRGVDGLDQGALAHPAGAPKQRVVRR